MGLIEDKLNNLGIYLEPPKPPVANYVGSKRAGNLLFVSGRKSELTGKVGKTVTEAQAKDAARDTVVLILSIIKNDILDLDLIESVVKVQGFIQCSKKFNRLPQVLDGASALLIELFGEQGRHARTATGAAQLPYDATIQLDMILQLKSTK
ncbi:MAG: RidA family protein [Saprospiraceae bacterium]|jgi:enamine deaminase RidA (YjgF/YER057c/UK114 family)|nr:RidA family protein [Lewinellaceae bacterium]